MYAGSVNTANKSRPQRFQKNEDIVEGISELVLLNKIYPSKELNKVYQTTVMERKFKALRLTRKIHGKSDGGIKIRIGPA